MSTLANIGRSINALKWAEIKRRGLKKGLTFTMDCYTAWQGVLCEVNAEWDTRTVRTPPAEGRF